MNTNNNINTENIEDNTMLIYFDGKDDMVKRDIAFNMQ